MLLDGIVAPIERKIMLIQNEQMADEIKTLFQQHSEILIIYADPVSNTTETAVGAFVKMLDKDNHGKLASLLDSILSNLKATCSEKRGRATNQTPTYSQESSC
jgi:hypothetical protein